MRFRILVLQTIIFLFIPGIIQALDISDPYTYISEILDPLIDPNEGETTFRSLLIPSGGRSEAMGMAFTALANDIGFFESNPAGSATMKDTELSALHNNWIGDSRLETISFTQRSDNIGYGASFRCFYLPFTEYNTYGERASRGYYTETLGVLNISYNFFSGYYFKGLAVGANLKAGYRGMPDYSDDNGNIISGSGATQSTFAIMGDVGIQTRFNLLKLYNSRDTNFNLGLSFRNFGPPILDDPLPSLITGGLAWKPANPITVAGEIQQPINLMAVEDSGNRVYGAGISAEFTSFFTLLGGFQLKGGNPRISLGAEMDVHDMRFNVTYTLDMTTQASIFNRISLAAKFDLGDRGRQKKQERIEGLYIKGLKLYAEGKLDEAIEIWEEVLELDKRFDPASEGIETAKATIEIQQQIREIQQLEKSDKPTNID